MSIGIRLGLSKGFSIYLGTKGLTVRAGSNKTGIRHRLIDFTNTSKKQTSKKK